MLEKPVGFRDEFSLDCVTVMPVGFLLLISSLTHVSIVKVHIDRDFGKKGFCACNQVPELMVF